MRALRPGALGALLVRAFPADPLFAVGPDLFLPDRHDALEADDSVLAALEGLVAVRRRHADGNRRLAHRKSAGAVANGHVRQPPALADLGGDLLHLPHGHLGVGLVLQVAHLAVARRAAHRAEEGHHPAALGRAHGVGHRLGGERLVGDLEHLLILRR